MRNGITGAMMGGTKSDNTIHGFIADGLVAYFDGIDNSGNGDEAHESAPTVWKDLAGNNHLTANAAVSGWSSNGWKIPNYYRWYSNETSSLNVATMMAVITDVNNAYYHDTFSAKGRYHIRTSQTTVFVSRGSDIRRWNNGILSNCICVTFDGENIDKTYQDGLAVTNYPYSDVIGFDRLQIGGNYSYQCTVHAFLIWDKKLSDDEIFSQWENAKSRFGL